MSRWEGEEKFLLCLAKGLVQSVYLDIWFGLWEIWQVIKIWCWVPLSWSWKKSWNPWQADTKPAPNRTETHSPAWWRTADMTLLKSYTHNKQIFHPCFSYSTEHQEGRTRKGRKDHHPHILHVGANNSYYLHFSHSSLPLFRQNLSFALTSCFFIRSSTTHLQAHQIHGREPRQLLPLFAPRSPLCMVRAFSLFGYCMTQWDEKIFAQK